MGAECNTYKGESEQEFQKQGVEQTIAINAQTAVTEIDEHQKETLSVIDNRTHKSYELNIKENCIIATELLQIKDSAGTVTRSYDPAYMNTVVCTSRISFIDGDKGIL
jgi:citrate synthase